jgi:hypothetical protein
MIVGGAGLLLGLVVALNPQLVYAPTPRVILYMLIALLPAILFAAEATASFKFSLPGFVASTGGAAAILLIVLLVLTHLTKPEAQIAVFDIVDKNSQPIVGLDERGAVEVPLTSSGIAVKPLVDGNTIVLIFPEQAPVVELLVRPISTGPVYRGSVSYAGNRKRTLELGRDLLARQR